MKKNNVKISVYLNEKLKKWVERKAHENRRSISNIVVLMIEKEIKNERPE